MPSEFKDHFRFACGYPGCGQHFGNKGAFATHTKFAHSVRVNEFKDSLHLNLKSW